MTFHNICAVLMDMDGTLFDTETLAIEGFLRGAAAYDVPMEVEHILSFRGRNKEENGKRFEELGFGDMELYSKVRAIRDEYVLSSIEENGVPEKPGLWELLEYLKDSNLISVVATGTARERAELYWEKSGILPYIDYNICGNEVTHSKPDPEIFLKAAEKAGVPIEQCVVLEDSPNGVISALASGARVILIPDLTPASEDEKRDCDFVVETLHDVIPCLQVLEASLN